MDIVFHNWLFGVFMQFSLTAGVQRVKAARASLMAYSGMIFAVVWDDMASFSWDFEFLGNYIDYW